MNNKIYTALISTALCACLLSGCALPGKVTETKPPVTTQPAVTGETSSIDFEDQIKLLADSQSQWQQPEEPGTPYYYAVTDLDRNGRLEILAMSTQGTGVFTYGKIYEVNNSGSALAECSLGRL